MALLLELPLPLLRDILSNAVDTSEDICSILQLRLVNNFFNYEIFKFLARNRLRSIPYNENALISYDFKFRLVREHIGDYDRRGSRFQSHIHAVLNHLEHFLSRLPPAIAPHIKSRDDLLDSICRAIIHVGFYRKLFGADDKVSSLPEDMYDSIFRKRICQAKCPRNRREKLSSWREIRYSAVLIAIIHKWDLIVPLLLKDDDGNSVDIKFRCKYFGRPLEIAMRLGHAEMVETLISGGARINTSSRKAEHTVLEPAASRNNLSVLKAIHASVQTVSRWAWMRASRRAGRCGHWEICKWMWNVGIEPYDNDPMTNKQIYEAARQGRIDIVKLCLSKGFPISGTDWRDYTILQYAIERGHLDMVWFLFLRGARVEIAKDERDTKWFHAAIRGGNVKIMEALLHYGVQPLWKNDDMWVQLCSRGHWELAKYFVERGAYKRISNSELRSSLGFGLRHAVVKGRTEMVRWLITEMGLNPSGEELEGDEITPLILAIDAGNQEMVKLLLNLGARIEELEKKGTQFGGVIGRKRRISNNTMRRTLCLRLGKFGRYVATDKKVFAALRVAKEYSTLEGTTQNLQL